MTSRFKDPRAVASRVETFKGYVRDSLERRSKLIGPQRNEAPADTIPDTVRRTLEEALEVINVQHTELVAAEEELREQLDELARTLGIAQVERERYRELFDAAPDAYFVTDAHGVIREANDRAVEMIGSTLRYVCGKPLALYLSSPGLTEFRDALLDMHLPSVDLRVELVGRKKAPIDVRLRARRLDGGRRILWIAREEERPVPGEVGDLARALRDKEELLEREKRERERLDREARAKDRFLAILSHDLRAPLNAVLGWTDLLRRELLDQARRERALSTIDRNARALLALVEELLDISRITADKLQLDVRPLDVSTLVRRIVDATHPAARDKGIVLGCTIEDAAIVAADAKRIEQSVTNLLSNALKFTPSGGKIDIAVGRVGDHVCISVRDSGQGIAAETLPHVFECFTQGSTPGTKLGLGLGLYIVRQIALLHGGSAHAQSEGPGRGATFTIELPVADRGPAAADSAHLPVAANDLTGLRILVIDDDEDTRDLMGTLLADTGAHIASAGDLSSASNLIETWSPDVVISDLSMDAHDDGIAIVRAARDRYGEDIVVLAVTGFASERDASRCLAAGFDAHLSKPLAGGELIAAITRLREGREGSPTVTRVEEADEQAPRG